MFRKLIPAQKLGMTHVFDEKGIQKAVTVLSLYDLFVCDLKTEEKHGYAAIVLGYKMGKKANKPIKSFVEKKSLPEVNKFFEIRVDSLEGIEVGQAFECSDIIESVEKVNLVGTSIGKGFAGAMKRHNFGGLRASHGVSISHRSHGSTGACQDPGKVFKNKKMAGQLGNKQVTVKNASIIQYDKEKKLLFLLGGVPGANKTVVNISVG